MVWSRCSLWIHPLLNIVVRPCRFWKCHLGMGAGAVVCKSKPKRCTRTKCVPTCMKLTFTIFHTLHINLNAGYSSTAGYLSRAQFARDMLRTSSAQGVCTVTEQIPSSITMHPVLAQTMVKRVLFASWQANHLVVEYQARRTQEDSLALVAFSDFNTLLGSGTVLGSQDLCPESCTLFSCSCRRSTDINTKWKCITGRHFYLILVSLCAFLEFS